MNFDQLTYPLTEFLTEMRFSVIRKEQHFIAYSSASALITVAYAHLERLFYTHVGQDADSLVELTPVVVNEVFNDDQYRLQSTLTIQDLITFFKTTGRPIISGDKEAFRRITEFSKQQSAAFTKRIISSQYIRAADNAWTKKDYAGFIHFIDQAGKEQLSDAFLKKYRIAVNKLQRKANQ